MPEYLSPGVYIEEVEIGSKPIEGVSTSTAGFVGVTQIGATEGLPELVTSFADFERKFGGYLSESYSQYRFLPYAVESFFANGGSRCYVMRIAPSDAENSKNESVTAGVVQQFTGDQSAGDTVLALEYLRGIDTKSTLTVERLRSDGTVEASETDIEIAAYNSSRNEVTISSPLVNDYPKSKSRVIVKKLAGGAVASGSTLSLYATSKGAWGDGIKVRCLPSVKGKTQIIEIIGDESASKQYKIKNKNGFYKGAVIEFDNGSEKQYRRISAIQEDLITLSAHLDGDGEVIDLSAIPSCTISTCEFSIYVSYGGNSEAFSNLSMNPDSNNYFMKAVNNSSTYITLQSPYTSASDFTREDPFDMPVNSSIDGGKLIIGLKDGSDGTVGGITPADFKGKDNGPGKRTGLVALNDIDEISIIAAPGVTDINVQLGLIEHCELLKDRFAVIDVPENAQKVSDVQAHRRIFDSSYAAMYHPWLQVFDPLEKRNIFIPPSGTVSGIYARSDNTRGIHKAPANEVLRSIPGLKYSMNKGEQDILNPEGVNLIRYFPGRGIRIWGARTCSSNTLWKYVNVRRLFLYLEESIDKGSQWVVFEPNDEKLWARVRLTITEFLTRVWRDGALMGSKPEEAFFVKADRTTMTQDDIDNGRLIVQIGVAPVKPAEFVIFRIAQYSGGSEVSEG